jgi:hypothetical protein
MMMTMMMMIAQVTPIKKMTMQLQQATKRLLRSKVGGDGKQKHHEVLQHVISSQ